MPILTPPSSSRKRVRSTSPAELNIYDSDDDDVVEQILTRCARHSTDPVSMLTEAVSSRQAAKRSRTGAKVEPFDPPAGSFVNGEVIDLTGDDSD